MRYIDYYSYYYEYRTPASPLATIISLALGVLLIVAMWMIFKKAGKPGWAAIVPFYNIYVEYEITWGSGWRFLLLLIPIYNIILAIPDAGEAGQGVWQERRLCCGTHFPALCIQSHSGF